MAVDVTTDSAKRSTVYFDPELHRVLRIKSVHTHPSISELVNEARMALQEDQENLAAFQERTHEATMTYEDLLKDLKAHSKI